MTRSKRTIALALAIADMVLEQQGPLVGPAALNSPGGLLRQYEDSKVRDQLAVKPSRDVERGSKRWTK